MMRFDESGILQIRKQAEPVEHSDLNSGNRKIIINMSIQ
jgi:hypothetical protein